MRRWSVRSARVQNRQPEAARIFAPFFPYIFMDNAPTWSKFDRIAQEFEVAIVEDAAQAIGAEWSGAARARSVSLPPSVSIPPRT
jgi:hypothetical protein